MKTKSFNRALKLFTDFTGDNPEYIDTVDLPVDSVAMAIGHCDAVMYETVREGKTEKYVHKFKKGARPVLAVSSDGSQLYILGGNYIFTDRGIEG